MVQGKSVCELRVRERNCKVIEGENRVVDL
jgi:hypothetical protein